jgi:hypothetical protein
MKWYLSLDANKLFLFFRTLGNFRTCTVMSRDFRVMFQRTSRFLVDALDFCPE